MAEDKNTDPVYSNKIKAGRRRTYFIDVRKTKGDDFFLTLTESTRRFDGNGFDRHKLFLYKEDFNRFLEGLEDAIQHVKTELMPDYDYEEFDRRHEENENNYDSDSDSSDPVDSDKSEDGEIKEDEISW